jgi:diguanylate cyclase (GGDEF)-like protein
MGVPVFGRDGEILYSLNIGMQPRQIGEILKRHPLPDGWLVAVIDNSGTIVARTRDAERFVGQKAVPELVERILQERSGTMEAVTKEGIPVSTAFIRSQTWNWTVAAAAPRAILEAGIVSLFVWLGVAVLVLVTAGSWLAAHIASRVVSSVHYLNEAALALREGKPVTVPKIELQEAEAVGQAIVQASLLMAKVRHRAYHDPLTELGNRSMFYEMVQHQLAIAEREGKQLAVLAIDLDKFKLVNDEEGHAAGDHLLASVARRIENTIRATDAAARMGGDEFSILLVDVDEQSAEETAQRLLGHLAEPYDGIRTPISASIGIAIYPDAGMDLAELLENADRALYAAKRGGRNAACMAGVRPTLH